MFVCFTGPGHDRTGATITRKDLAELATAAGHTVQTGVTEDTDLLVSSRDDTLKAKKAKALEVPVTGYSQFIEDYLKVKVHG